MIVIPDTEVRLLNAVPLSNTYEHQLTFASETAQTNYFLGKSQQTFLDFTYQREDATIKVPKSRDSLYSCNYVMYKNKEFGGKWFYGFITKLEYVNPGVTKVHFEIDVFQTWYFKLNFKPSFVVREHAKRWNADGSPVINTIDEGLDYGSEYVTKQITQFVPYTDVFFLVIVATQKMDTNNPGQIKPTLNGSPQPLSYYVHPFKMDGTIPTVMMDGFNIGLSDLSTVLRGLYSIEGAVNNIAALYVTEYPGFNVTYTNGVLTLPIDTFDHATIQDPDTTGETLNTVYVKNLENYQTMYKTFGDKYTGYTQPTESKLLMHPYTVTVLTDLKGNHQEIKNEYIQATDLDISVKGSMGTSNKVSYNVRNYLMEENTLGTSSEEAALQTGIINNSPNDVPIISDLLSAYLQGNRNQLQNQQNQIQFNAITGLAGSVMSGLGSALSRNPAGVFGSAVEGGTGMMGSYFQMAGLQAKQKDLDTMPPQLSRMGGNTAFDYGNDIKGLYIIKKEITEEYRKKLTDFFKMFGYKINEVKTPVLKSRQHFNFLQLTGANITGNVPVEDLVKIKNMFNNGVTLWHGDWVGDYSLPNGEI
jgi:hypothetical protein